MTRTFESFTKSAYSRTFRKQAAKEAFNYVKDFFIDGVKGQAVDKAVEGYCEGIYNKIFSAPPVISSIDSASESAAKALDIFDIKATMATCATSDKLACAKGTVDAIAAFDPTGILTIASAFMYPTCSDITQAEGPIAKTDVAPVLTFDQIVNLTGLKYYTFS